MKILNLYGGIGGNRKLWDSECEITAIEINEKIAEVYSDYFPQDKLIVADAHEYLLNHFAEYDFIWSSPPCQSHSSFRKNICVRYRGTQPCYPDMNLYQEVLFLKHHFQGLWIVENVKPYYKPLIEPNKILQRHYLWCNFQIDDKDFNKDKIRSSQIPQLSEIHGYDLSGYKLPNKRQILRNCVLPELGLHIFRTAWRILSGGI